MVISELVGQILFDIDDSGLKQFHHEMNATKEVFGPMIDRINSMGAAISFVGKKLSLFVSAPLAALGTLSVKSAAEIEQVQTSFEVLLGSAEKADATLKELFDFEARTPFNLEDVLTFSDRLLQAKYEASDLTSIMTTFGDITAGNSEKMKALIRVMSDVKNAGKLTGNDYFQFTTAGVPIRRLLTEAGISGTATYDQVFKVLQEFAKTREGFMGKQSKTLAGLFSSLQSAIFRFRVELGKLIVDELHLDKIVSGLISVMNKFSGWLKNAPSWLRTVVVWLGLFLIALGPILVLLGSLIPVITGLSLALMVFPAVASGFVAAFATMGAAILGFITKLGPIGLIISAISVAIMAVYEDIKTWVTGGKSLIGEFIGPWQELGKTINELLNFIKTDLDNFWNSIGNKFSFIGKFYRELTRANNNDINMTGSISSIGSVPLSTLDNNRVSKSFNKTIVVKSNIQAQIPEGTQSIQKSFIKETARKSVEESWNSILADAYTTNERLE